MSDDAEHRHLECHADSPEIAQVVGATSDRRGGRQIVIDVGASAAWSRIARRIGEGNETVGQDGGKEVLPTGPGGANLRWSPVACLAADLLEVEGADVV